MTRTGHGNSGGKHETTGKTAKNVPLIVFVRSLLMCNLTFNHFFKCYVEVEGSLFCASVVFLYSLKNKCVNLCWFKDGNKSK